MNILDRILPGSMKKSPDMTADQNQFYNAKTKFGLVGTVSAGKSTIAAAIVYMCSLLSAVDPNFYCHVQPNCKQILLDVNNLRIGRFPKKTDPLMPNAPIQGIVIGQKGVNAKSAQIPLLDVAGEITDYIEAKSDGNTPYEQIQRYVESVNIQVLNLLQDCKGIIIALDASEAIIFRSNFETKDNDTYTHNVVNSFLQYRKNQHKDEPYVIVVLTKWDQVNDMAKIIGMNANDKSQNGLDKFLANGFPLTHMLLKPLREKGKVKYFTTWFKLQKREDGSVVTWDDGSPRIKMKSTPGEYIISRPDASEDELKEMIMHIASFGQ